MTSTTAGTCAEIQITPLDASNQVAAVSAGGTITLSGASSGAFYGAADTTCTATPITTIDFSTGDTAKVFHYKNLSSESVTLAGTISSGFMVGASTNHALSVNVGAASLLAVTTQPNSSAVAGITLSTPPVVQIADYYGNLVNSSAAVGVEVHTNAGCTAAENSGTLTGGAATASSGSATFSSLNFTKAGTYYFKFTSSSLTSVCSTAVTISHAAASQIAFTTEPSSSTGGTAFATQPVVKIYDTYNNLVTSGADATATITLSLPSGTGVLAGTNSMNAVAGVADFAGKGLNINLSGAKTLRASKADTSGSGGTTAKTADTASFTISVGGATQLVFTVLQTFEWVRQFSFARHGAHNAVLA